MVQIGRARPLGKHTTGGRAGRSDQPVFEVKLILWSSVSLSDLYCSAIAGVEDLSLRCRDEVYNKIKMVRQNPRLTCQCLR